MTKTETQSISLFMFLAWGCYSSSNDQDEGTENTVVVLDLRLFRVYMHLQVRMGDGEHQ